MIPWRLPAAPGLMLAALVSIALTTGAAAGPCPSCAPDSSGSIGWWNDRALQPGEVDDHAPRIEVDGDGVTSRIAITWERRSSGAGDTWLATSDDGGCSWDARAIAPGPEDDRVPDVAVSQSQGAVALAFVRGNLVVATISLDGGRTFSPPEVVDPAAPADATSRPRLAMIPAGGALHLDVAWSEGGAIHLARSIASGAAGSWIGGPPLSARLAGFSGWTDVEIAADTRSRDASMDSAVTVVASGLAPGSTTPEIFALRSNDSGATFFGDPATPSSIDVPARVSDVRPSNRPAEGAVEPALDVSDDGTGEFYTWEAVAYSDLGVPGGACRADARAEEGAAPSTIADWNNAAGDFPVGDGARASALAVLPNPLQRPPSPEAHIFSERTSLAGREVDALRSMLDVNTPGWILETCPSYRLTGVAPPRARGAVVARSFAADEDLSHVFVAWADTRDGGSSIYWKRTDTVVAPATNVRVAPADCATGGGLLVTWDLPPSPPSCDIDHVHVEYGRVPGGLDGSVDVASGTSTIIGGVVAGTTYFARVTIIDEACNEAPAAEVSGASASCVAPACPNPVGGSLRGARRPTDGDVDLWWLPPPVDASHGAAASYDVYRAVVRARDGFALVRNVPGPGFQDLGGALPGTALRHFYLIVARNSCGTSGDEPLP